MYQQMLMMQQQMLMMAQALDQVKGTNMAEQIAAGITGTAVPMAGQAPSGNVEETEALGGNEKAEASNTKKARQRVAESTSPT